MITYETLRAHPGAFRSLTGHSPEQFDALYRDFAVAYQQRRAQRRPGRKRAPGAGRRFVHPVATRLLMALLWLRVYPTFAVLGFFFGLHKSNAFRTVEDVLATLATLCDFTFERPTRERKALGSVVAVMDAFPDVALVIDAKEQRIRRPKSRTDSTPPHDQQKPYYSGKKKAHTLKNQIAVTPEGKVGAVSDSVAGGANHDLTLLRDSRLLDHLAADEAALLDKGYDGITKDDSNKILYLPYKARRGHPLTEEHKAYNRHLSRYRIVVEHTLAQMNQFEALRQVWRHGRDRHTSVVRAVAQIINRRIQATPLKTYPAA